MALKTPLERMATLRVAGGNHFLSERHVAFAKRVAEAYADADDGGSAEALALTLRTMSQELQMILQFILKDQWDMERVESAMKLPDRSGKVLFRAAVDQARKTYACQTNRGMDFIG